MHTKDQKFVSSIKRRELGAELRRIRERAGFRVATMAFKLNWAHSSVSRLEEGITKTKEGRVGSYLGWAKATTAEFDRLVALDRQPDDGYLARPHPAGCPDGLLVVSLLDTESDSFSTYDPRDIPRHLQIEPYIRTVLSKLRYQDGPALDAAVRDRLDRQPSWTRRHGPFIFYVPETALPADLAVTHEQLVHLSILSSLPHCHVRLVPAGASTAELSTGFTLYRHDEHPPVLHLQSPTASLFLERQVDIAFYESQLERLTELALSRQETREWFTSKLADIERHLEHDQPLLPGCDEASREARA
jgi:transcriptional regulator with XRE-family HTH domain